MIIVRASWASGCLDEMGKGRKCGGWGLGAYHVKLVTAGAALVSAVTLLVQVLKNCEV